MAFDLKAYFNRINYNGDASLTFNTLNAITEAHAKAITFENLDVILHKRIFLSDEAIFEKLVTNQRGGYCFEQNALMLQALTHLGFEARPLSARVRLRFTTREPVAPRTHVFVGVKIGAEDFITDVGMGSGSLTQALRFNLDQEQETPHDVRKITKENNIFYHQVRYGDVWQDACEFTLEEMPLIDREVANWYTSAHPQSHFRGSVIAARAIDKGERITLQNLDFTLRKRNGDAEKKQLKNTEEMVDALVNDFGLSLTSKDKEGLKQFKIS